MRPSFLVLVLAALSGGGQALAAAPSCSDADLAKAVDDAGAALRRFNAEEQPKLEAKLEQLRVKNGWSKEEAAEKGLGSLEDERLRSLDTRSDELLTKIDTLGRPSGSAADCSAIPAIEQAGEALIGTMKEKSTYTLAKLDKALGIEAAPAPPPPSTAEPKPAETKVAAPAPPKPSSAAVPQASPQSAPKPAMPALPAPPQRTDPLPWSTTTAGPPPSATGQPSPLFVPDPNEDGYTIEEIRDATGGFFGTISTNLATVLEHAFSVAGKPTAYVLGTEGGGAFLAGLRYGEGTLYMRQGGKSKIYWHGPSIGTDFGASGSRTLFLIYKLRDADEVFRTYTGVDGSAYLVGGIGFTLMKGGKVVLAPIRTGLGLRFGANIGYVRFTPQATWNPF